MAVFVFHVTTPANTPPSNKQVTRLHMSAGVITKFDIYFPPGCAGLVYCQVRDALHQVFPRNPQDYFQSDDETITFITDYPLLQEPLELYAYTWNLDDTYGHTIALRFSVGDMPTGGVIIAAPPGAKEFPPPPVPIPKMEPVPAMYQYEREISFILRQMYERGVANFDTWRRAHPEVSEAVVPSTQPRLKGEEVNKKRYLVPELKRLDRLRWTFRYWLIINQVRRGIRLEDVQVPTWKSDYHKVLYLYLRGITIYNDIRQRLPDVLAGEIPEVLTPLDIDDRQDQEKIALAKEGNQKWVDILMGAEKLNLAINRMMKADNPAMARAAFYGARATYYLVRPWLVTREDAERFPGSWPAIPAELSNDLVGIRQRFLDLTTRLFEMFRSAGFDFRPQQVG